MYEINIGAAWILEIDIGAARIFERGLLLFPRVLLSCLQEYVVVLYRVDQSYGKAYLFTLVPSGFQEI